MAPRRTTISLLLLFAAVAATSATSSLPAATAEATAFLRARCATTRYPAVCYESLLPHALRFQTSHAKLARAAADVMAARLHAFSARLKELLASAGGGSAEAAALRDCTGTVSAAAGLAKKSSDALGRLEAAALQSSQARWEAANAKTWLSAALTNEGTCADGVAESATAAASAAGKEAAAAAASAKQYTSNALALVNGIPL